MKKIVTIQDISCVGRCSITVALPVLSAMGVETSILPTAMYSTHTMFPNPTVMDLADRMPDIAEHWKQEGITFDAIYIGYLAGIRHIHQVFRFVNQFKGPETLLYLDPAMADHGVRYKGLPEGMEEEMKKLCSHADILLPNLTEACLLTGTPYEENPDTDFLRELLKKLAFVGGKQAVVITGVTLEGDPSKTGAIGRDNRSGEIFSVSHEKLPGNYPGTGDLFASTVLGGLENDLPLPEALQIAGDFVSDAIRETIRDGKDRRFGVNFEPALPKLIQTMQENRQQENSLPDHRIFENTGVPENTERPENTEKPDYMEDRQREIAQNLSEVREQIRIACEKVGRDPGEVTLCAVSKKKPITDILAARDAGQHLFGENYVQELQEKTAEPYHDVEFHMIGHLQRNKVKYLIGKVSMIHSVDSMGLAEQIEKEAAKKDVVMDILLEVNIAEEKSKWGFDAENLLESACRIAALPHVRIRGLMTSAPYTPDPESNREYFRELRQLKDALAKLEIPGTQIDTLSMGMTGDYAVAVEEGSTMVRVGTGIFGEREYH